MKELTEIGNMINENINDQLKLIESSDIDQENKTKLRDFANGIKKSIATQDTELLNELIKKFK